MAINFQVILMTIYRIKNSTLLINLTGWESAIYILTIKKIVISKKMSMILQIKFKLKQLYLKNHWGQEEKLCI